MVDPFQLRIRPTSTSISLAQIFTPPSQLYCLMYPVVFNFYDVRVFVSKFWYYSNFNLSYFYYTLILFVFIILDLLSHQNSTNYYLPSPFFLSEFSLTRFYCSLGRSLNYQYNQNLIISYFVECCQSCSQKLSNYDHVNRMFQF